MKVITTIIKQENKALTNSTGTVTLNLVEKTWKKNGKVEKHYIANANAYADNGGVYPTLSKAQIFNNLEEAEAYFETLKEEC